LSLVRSWRAFSANSGQFEAGSTITGSSFFPSTPPLALISAMVISAVSLRDVSLIAIVPDSEWRMPTLMVSAARAGGAPSRAAQRIDDNMSASFRVYMGLGLLGPVGPGSGQCNCGTIWRAAATPPFHSSERPRGRTAPDESVGCMGPRPQKRRERSGQKCASARPRPFTAVQLDGPAADVFVLSAAASDGFVAFVPRPAVSAC